MSDNPDLAKIEASERALSLIKDNQCVGLGTGSTSKIFIEKLAKLVNKNKSLNISCVASSVDSSLYATSLGLYIIPIENVSQIDISVDGCDEIDSNQNLIKGGGAAHTREKLVHIMSKKFVLISDKSKKVDKLGEKFLVPVEILPIAYTYVTKSLNKLGGKDISLRSSKGKCGPIVTDNNNWILDVKFEITDPLKLETQINEITGVVENGIFAKIKPLPENCFIV